MPQSEIFVDTVFVVGLINVRDQHHPAAQRAADLAAGRRWVTTEPVLFEIGAMCARSYRAAAARALAELRASDEVEIVPTTPDRLDRALRLFARYEDKSWSLADCFSFVVMRERSLEDALTADEHFQQAGFRAWMQ